MELNIKGLFAHDSTNWHSKFKQGVEKNGYGIIWRNHLSDWNEIIPQLKKLIEDYGSFPFYNLAQNKVNYKFNIIDFATKDDYETKKNDWKIKNPFWYEDRVSDYQSGTQKAKIVFLVDNVEEINTPIHHNDFVTFNKNAAQTNVAAFKYIKTEISKEMNDYIEILEKKKNIILQGAPGVGKTYTTAELALAICDGIEKVPYNHDDVMKRYEQLQKEGRIGFVTFHQSMDYEDFVEGIKPSTDNGTITYDVEDGIFKQISIKAQAGNNFDEIYDKFISEINEYDEENVCKLKTPKGTIFGVTVNTKNNLSLYVGSELQKTATLTKENIRKMSEDDKSVKYYQPYFRGVVNILKSKGLKSQKNTDKNYVLIIDEINRGNVSKIFGELITLLEADKRIDGDHPIKVTLPYSKEEFGVPSNLYIIGTMNTTDRSVGNIDYAVRRRFAFVTLKADVDVLIKKYGKDSIQVKLFNAVNEFVDTNNANELDLADLKVGHSFFMVEEKQLRLNLDYEIIPLLREYYKDGLLKQDITPAIAGTWRAASLPNKSDVTQSSTPDPTPAASTQTT
ncbi:MAG: AAA family ATPase [Bacteroidales bacterium]|nr:AAA family ATPase [Bacteroidales bacterium]